jgi:hypothetical protein
LIGVAPAHSPTSADAFSEPHPDQDWLAGKKSLGHARSDGKSEGVKMLEKQRARAGGVNICERNTL